MCHAIAPCTQREDNIVAMRKNKREETLQKRRNMAGDDPAISEGALSMAGGPQGAHPQVVHLTPSLLPCSPRTLSLPASPLARSRIGCGA